jgi:hypothetical protein
MLNYFCWLLKYSTLLAKNSLAQKFLCWLQVQRKIWVWIGTTLHFDTFSLYAIKKFWNHKLKLLSLHKMSYFKCKFFVTMLQQHKEKFLFVCIRMQVPICLPTTVSEVTLVAYLDLNRELD